ncbi:genetic competence negative regulator [Neobacillus mesonae]|uniref:genetic competence negative regulator n=1 Tax=Neobacillus mesonae TaxID=1193713 RepID=UPI00203F50DC|nr:genetic competence negative regulator [Neobacillus mesonae]MCM3566762.1 genetic competence negative regulator [Neobacillus mesonae]
MRLERLTANKIKIFLTSDDLMDRGLTKEDIWKDAGKWNQLFHDMLEEASMELDVDIQGSVAVEVFSLQAQGMIMIITVEEFKEYDEMLNDGFIEMQVRACGFEKLLFEFDDFENLISVSKRLSTAALFGGSLFSMNGRYYLLMDQLETKKNEMAACILSEFGNASILSPHILAEYGKVIMKDKTVETIIKYFK